eukprot:TRINITY_DN2131_c0_g7_i1.p1 TRINITY_DN2131_c0_g7~~TRINITY_DN2131_c0_g7_i1.p1  ORF type:complete len:2102 (+),score=387.98 TRINITY_DN2131_c0_g7_i1:35-6307(+)
MAVTDCKQSVQLWWCQFEALTLKCAETLLRRAGALFVVFVAPVLALGGLVYLKSVSFAGVSDVPFPDAFELAPLDTATGKPLLPACIIFDTAGEKTSLDCVNLAYSWSNESGAEDLARSIASGLACSSDACAEAFATPSALADAFFDAPGKYDAGFIVDSAGAAGLRYTIWKNVSSEELYMTKASDHFHFVKVQKAVEEAALRVGLGLGSSLKMTGSVRANVRKFPELRTEGLADSAMPTGLPNIIDTSGAMMILFGLTIASVFTMQLIAEEKRSGLLGLLRMTGLRESTYWLSWFVCLSAAFLLSGLLLACVGKLTSIEVFNACSIGVHMMAAFSYSMASCAFIMMCAACVKEPWAVQLTQFGVVMLNILFQSFVAAGYFNGAEIPVDFWTSRAISNPDYSAAEKMMVILFPAFQYGKIFQSILDVTGTDGGRSAMQTNGHLGAVPVRSYNWSNVHMPVGYAYGDDVNETIGFSACFEGTPAYDVGCTGITKMCTNATWSLPSCPTGVACNELSTCDWVDSLGNRVGSWYGDSVGDCMGFMFVEVLVFLLMAWYLAQVLSAGLGSSKPFYFPLMPSYWTSSARSVDALAGKAQEEKQLSASEGSCRLLKMSKSYAETTALTELSLTMKQGEVFCLLGQNGAGKSTTISVLTGLHPMTHGEAFVKGHSIRTSMSTIQAMMGVCPQDNVLFEGLSGRSHLLFWGRFKGMSWREVGKEADRLLASVGLLEKAKVSVGSYSGGMKRRLSVAIAAVAAPSIVFLDEPTTGLDPLSRMRTWEAISSLKKGRIVCLTTHSMEEADCLGDTIGILASGRLRALGAPLFLKGRFGTGYHVTLLCDEGKADEVVALLQTSLPTADIISNVAGHITVGVPRRMFHLVPAFFARLEQTRTGGARLVNEWSISASTLEEVFLKVAVSDKSLNAAQEDLTAAEVDIAQHLLPGLALHALEGRAVHMSLTNAEGTQIELDHIKYMLCSSPTDVPTVPHVEEQVVDLDAGIVEQEAAVNGSVQQEANETASCEVEASTVQVGDNDVTRDCLPRGEKAVPTPTMSSQNYGLLVKNAMLQRKQWKANVCRVACSVIFVILSVALNLLLGSATSRPGTRSSSSCSGGFTIESDQFFNFHGVDAGGASCEKGKWSEYMVRSGACTSTDASAEFDNFYSLVMQNSSRDTTSQVTASLWKQLVNTIEQPVQQGRGQPAVTTSGSEDVCSIARVQDALAPSTCSAGSPESSMSSALCGSFEMGRIPDMCRTRNFELKFSSNFYTEWSSIDFKQPGVEASRFEQVGTTKIWYQGPNQTAMLLGLHPHRWMFANSSSWNCGPARTVIEPQSSIEEAFISNQQVQRTRAVPPSEMTCLNQRRSERDLNIPTDLPSLRVPTVEASWRDGLKDFKDLFPDIGLSVSSVDTVRGSVDYDVWVYGLTTRFNDAERDLTEDYPFVRTAVQDSDQSPCTTVVTSLRETSSNELHEVVGSMSDSVLQMLWQSSASAGETPHIAHTIVPLPRIAFSQNAQAFSAFIVLLFLPVVSLMFFPAMVSLVQAECVEKNVLALQVQGMHLVSYWASTYFWNSFLYLGNVFVFYVANLIAGVAAFQNAHQGRLILVLLLWGHSQISLAVFMAVSLGRSKLTIVLSYLIIIATMIAGPTLARMSFERWSIGLLILPPMNFVRCIMLVLLKGANDMSTAESSEFSDACVLQFFLGLLMLIVGIFGHVLRQGTITFADVVQAVRENGSCSKVSDEAAAAVAAKDDDVEAEERRVASEASLSDAVRVHNLFKTYGSGFKAVQGVSFGIKSGECFGLLGPNGAGKTTMISMLSGTVGVTSGEASVGGFSVLKQMKRIRQILGICPQFDIVWKELTVLEHLLTFARIKGVPRKVQMNSVMEVAEAVGLDGDPLRKAARSLSGGMRRRLSLGNALVGNPDVVFLDEPSTGLDPETRHSLWRVISGLTHGRCVVLTTHSMEEADALCGRIGIMAFGRMRCLGTPTHLKNKFGKGFQLAFALRQTNATAEAFEKLDVFVKTKISAAALVLHSWKGANHRLYGLPLEGTLVSTIFESITDEVKDELSVQDWSLNQTSLNEVFLRIAAESEHNQPEAAMP